MAIINNTLVAKSSDVHAAALNLNAKAFEVRKTIAGVWDLKPTASKAPESAFNLDMKNEGSESVVEGDDRVRVDDKHFQPGGKYRSIVKLFLRYEFGGADQWAHGTGWLIKPDILVTAGHCAYDWGHRLGRAVEVKAYIGYKGRDQISDPSVQFRSATRIVTSEGWLQTKGSKPKDVSLIQLDKPFEGVTPVKYIDTPPMDDVVLGVVGYPADLKNEKTGERGAFMYEHFLQTKYDIAEQADTMIEYQIDTFGGNSGSPVLRQSDGAAIGVHVYGGETNSASVIGKYGNPVGDYVRAFGLPLPDNNGLNFINTSEAASATNGTAPADKSGPPEASLQAYAAHIQALNSVDEGFFDLIKSVVKVGGPIIGGGVRGIPGLGPFAGPLSSLVGVAVDSALKVTESGSTEGFFDTMKVGPKISGLQAGKANLAISRSIGAESSFTESSPEKPTEQSKPRDEKADKAAYSRAILREAALQTILTKDLKPEVQESIFDVIRDVVKKTAPVIGGLLPVLNPVAAIAVDNFIALQNSKQTESSLSQNPNAEAFFTNLQAAVNKKKKGESSFVNGKGESSFAKAESGGVGQEEDEEGFIDFIGSGIGSIGKIVGAVGDPLIGLPIGKVIGSVGNVIRQAESSIDSKPEGIFDTIGKIGGAVLGLPNLARLGNSLIIGPIGGLVGAESALQTTRFPRGNGAESSFSKGSVPERAILAESGDDIESMQRFAYRGSVELQDLIKRAFFAEAALQAVLKIDPKLLQKEEGFFDDIGDAFSDIGNGISDAAQSVAREAENVGRQVIGGVQQGVDQASDAIARAAVQAAIDAARRR